MVVRKAIEEDLERIAEIFTYGWRTAYFDLLPHDFLFNEIHVIQRYERLRKQWDHERFYVYEEENLIKGVMLLRKSQDADMECEAMELAALYVEPLFKRQGIGSKLMESFEKEAVREGKEELKLWVFANNELGRKFYEKHGFEAEVETTKIGHFNQPELRYRKSVVCVRNADGS